MKLKMNVKIVTNINAKCPCHVCKTLSAFNCSERLQSDKVNGCVVAVQSVTWHIQPCDTIEMDE